LPQRKAGRKGLPDAAVAVSLIGVFIGEEQDG